MSVLKQDNKIARNLSGEILTEPPIISLDWNYGITKDGNNNVSKWKDSNNPFQALTIGGFVPSENGDGIYGGVMKSALLDLTGDWTLYLRFKNDAVLSGKSVITEQTVSPYTVYSLAIYGNHLYLQFTDNPTDNYIISTGFSSIIGKIKEFEFQKRGNRIAVFGSGGTLSTDPESDFFYYLFTIQLGSANIKPSVQPLNIGGAGDGTLPCNMNLYNLTFRKSVDTSFYKFVDQLTFEQIRPINTIL